MKAKRGGRGSERGKAKRGSRKSNRGGKHVQRI
jgi:hypothetical protein